MVASNSIKETLLQKQFRFARMLPRLLDKAQELGFNVTVGDTFRDPRTNGHMGEKLGYGAANSCHKLKLAVDVNLFLGTQYLDDGAAHKQLGEWWESQGQDYCWGGRFRDPNHYSISHDGHK